jgi:hypothetical protein
VELYVHTPVMWCLHRRAALPFYFCSFRLVPHRRDEYHLFLMLDFRSYFIILDVLESLDIPLPCVFVISNNFFPKMTINSVLFEYRATHNSG